MSSWWLWLLVAVLGAAVAVIALVRQIEPRLAFFPLRGESVAVDRLPVPGAAFEATTSDGQALRGWHLRPAVVTGQVLYFHGNGGNLSVWSDVLVGLAERNLEVIAIDYRGYGLSSGSPSERGLYLDADAVLEYAATHRPAEGTPRVYWGRSLGSVVAAYAASRVPPDRLVLEAAFPDMRAVLASNPVLWSLSWVSSYSFPTAQWMREVRAPTLVIHGDRDQVIPYALGERLYAGLREPKRFLRIAGGDHNDPAPVDPKVYWDPIARFLSSAAARQQSPRSASSPD